MLAVFIILFVVVGFLYHHFTKYNNYWKKRNIPGPEPTFFFGNFKELALRRQPMGEIIKEIYDKYPKEKLVGIFRMRTPDLMVKDLEIIKHVLIKDFDKFIDRDQQFSHQGLGANLFYSDGNTWRCLRKHFTPLFTSGKLKNMMYLLTKNCDKLVDYVDKKIVDQPEQEVHWLIKKFTQDNISACAFGIDLDCYDNEHSKALDILERQIFVMDHRAELEMMYPGILKAFNFSLMPEQVIRFFTNLAKDMIVQRNGEPTDRNDFVDLLLALRKAKQISGPRLEDDSTETLEMTDQVFASQMFIFYMAGYQTSAITMSFMLHYLARDNDIQERMLAEIETVLQKHGGELTYDALSEMKYMDQVMDETLRLHPIADTIRRRASTDYKIPGTDLTVEKGQILLIPLNVTQMDPNIFPDPEKFDPERFNPQNAGDRHPCAFLPFGNGPRQCIGSRFAKIQIKIGMAKLLQRFRVVPSNKCPERFQFESSRIAIYPIGGFPMKLLRRH